MLTFTAPSPLVGDLLETALADAGLATPVALAGGEIRLSDLDESKRVAAQAVVTAHPAAAQAALDAAAAERSNETTIRDRAEQALAANLSDITANDTFLALPTVTNAQVLAQVKELTRQSTRQARELNALVRLILRRFDGTG